MITVKQFNGWWTEYSYQLAAGCFNRDDLEKIIHPLSHAVAAEFKALFLRDIQEIERVPPQWKIAGSALKAVEAWIQAVDECLVRNNKAPLRQDENTPAPVAA